MCVCVIAITTFSAVCGPCVGAGRTIATGAARTLNRHLCMPNFAIFVKAELDGVASFSIPSDQCWVLDVKQVHHRPRLHWKFSTSPWQSLIPFSKLHGNSPPSL